MQEKQSMHFDQAWSWNGSHFIYRIIIKTDKEKYLLVKEWTLSRITKKSF